MALVCPDAKSRSGLVKGYEYTFSVSIEMQVSVVGGCRVAFVVYPDDQLAVDVLTNLVGASSEGFLPEIGEFCMPMQIGQPRWSPQAT